MCLSYLNNMKKYAYLFIVLVFAGACKSEEGLVVEGGGQFTSLVDIRLEFPGYGPSFKDILNPGAVSILKDVNVINLMKVGVMPLLESEASGLTCVAGLEITSKIFTFKGKQIDESKLFVSSFLEYENFGERFVMVFSPDFAFEILSKSSSVVFLFDSSTGMGRFSCTKWVGKGSWQGSVITVKPSIQLSIMQMIKTASVAFGMGDGVSP